MPRFRSRPAECEAVQFDPAVGHPAVRCTHQGASPSTTIYAITTRQGTSGIDPGDWIITEPDGAGFYPCKREIFEKRWGPIVEQLVCFKCGTALPENLAGARMLRISELPTQTYRDGDTISYTRRNKWGHFCEACLKTAPLDPDQLRAWALAIGAEKLAAASPAT